MNDQGKAHIHETDILIIGGGLSGLTAARKILSEGRRLIIVDKGPWGHSGTSGINWGHDMSTNEWAPGDGSESLPIIVSYNDGLVDQKYALELCRAVHEARPNATSEQMGGIAERLKDGRSSGKNASLPFTRDHGSFPRYFAQFIKQQGVTIFDRTMVIDLLQDVDGSIAGAVAIGLVDGEAHVFRAKAVIMATGSYAWVSGWNGMSPFTIAGPENTGDGHRMFFDLGLSLCDMEQQPFDCVQWDPLWARHGMGASGASIVNYSRVHNKNGDYFASPYARDPRFSNAGLMRLMAREIFQKRGTANNGVMLEIKKQETDNRYYRRCRERFRDAFALELPDHIEVVPEQWESAGRPANLDSNSQTKIDGLFYAGSGMCAWVGVGYFGCVGSGWMAGRGACARADKQKYCAVDRDYVRIILDRAYNILNANPSNPVRSTAVLRTVQEAYWKGLAPIRNAEGIRDTIKELESIESELLPRLFVPNKSQRFNTDWRIAIETKSLLACALGTAQAALLRTETRGGHCRTDYPETDNVNWLKHTMVKRNGSHWASWAEGIDDSIIPAIKIADLIINIGLLD